jgi:hypothetical protein
MSLPKRKGFLDLGTITITGKRENPFSISNFKNKIGNLARPNLFYAILGYGPGFLEYVNTSGLNVEETFSFRCEVAEIPGRTIATMDEAGGAGPALKLPYDVTYNDINLTIICSEDMKEREFFEMWMNAVVGKGGTDVGGLVNYYSNYAEGNILEIDQLDSAGKILSASSLYDVYPIALSSMTASWEETNSYQRFSATLAYRYYDFDVSDTAKNQRT